MKNCSSVELPGDTNWKIINSAEKRVSQQLRNRLQRSTPSYEEFILESSRNRHKEDLDLQEVDIGEDDFNYENYYDDDELHVLKDFQSAHRDGSDYDDVDQWNTESESNCSSAEADDGVGSKINHAKNAPKKKSSCNNKESSRGASNDEILDDFIKTLTLDLQLLDAADVEKFQQERYNDLTGFMLRTSNVEDKLMQKEFVNETTPKPAERFLSISAEEKLPLIQVLDTLNDINAVMKVGKLSPRMERIMEYKQDHPFSDGYEEDELGCCPWLIYKLERIYERFMASQWPN